MASSKHQAAKITVSLAVTALTLWGIFIILRLLWEAFSQVNSTVATGMVTASATIIVSVISVLVAKRLEFRAALAKEHREKKIPFYEGMVNFIFRMTFADKLGLEPITEKEMAQQMASFTENLIVWGADEVIDAWFKFRNKSLNSDIGSVTLMFEIEDLLLAIRRDLGHENKGLTRGKVLGLFINDIDEHIKV